MTEDARRVLEEGAEETSGIPCIDEALGTIAKQRSAVLAMAYAARVAEEVVALFPDLGVQSPRIGFDGGSLQGVLIFMGSFGSGVVKDVRAAFPVLKEFSRRGFKPVGEPSDYAEIGRRTWELRREPKGTPIQFSVMLATGPAEGATCRFEKIGVKEEPVWKLVCEPDSAPDAPAPTGGAQS